MITPNPRQLSNISRQEMYDLIWSTPAIKLAADFGVSDVAIAKRCKRLNVPRPSRGYPHPVDDGAFDAETIPFGGPYPPIRNLSTTAK